MNGNEMENKQMKYYRSYSILFIIGLIIFLSIGAIANLILHIIGFIMMASGFVIMIYSASMMIYINHIKYKNYSIQNNRITKNLGMLSGSFFVEGGMIVSIFHLPQFIKINPSVNFFCRL